MNKYPSKTNYIKEKNKILEFRFSNPEYALSLVKDLTKLAVKEKDFYLLSFCYHYTGDIYLTINDTDKAAEFLNLAIRLELKYHYTDMLATSYNTMGVLLTYLSNIILSVDYYYKALAIAKKETNYTSLANITNNIGLSYYLSGNYKEAIYYFNKSYYYIKYLTVPDEILFTHNNYHTNCSSSYFYLKEYKLCEEHFNQIQLPILIEQNSRLLPSIYSLKASFYFEQHDVERTLENCKLAINCLNNYYNSIDIFLSCCNVVELLLKMDMDSMAADLLSRLTKMIEHESYSERSESLYSLMATYYKKTGQLDQLKHTYKAYYELKQSSMKSSLQAKRLFMKTFLEFQQQRTITERINQRKESFQVLSHTDSLTGLPNRLAFNQNSTTIFEDCIKNQHLFAIIIIDLDNFKTLNDHYGHLAGDHVLQSVGTVLLNHTSENCFISRYGGDEFIAICKNLSETSIKEITNNIHKQLNTLTFPFVPEYRIITCSMGTSLSIPTKQQCISDYIRIADRALYTQKRNGKNGTYIITTI